MSNWNDKIIAEFRENEGRVGGPFEGSKLLLLTTTGAKTGEERVSPMMYFPGENGTVYVIASKGGAPENPAWYHNLVANPKVEIERATGDGIETYTATAEALEGEERAQHYAEAVTVAPGFGDYEKKTTRVIPMIALRRG